MTAMDLPNRILEFLYDCKVGALAPDELASRVGADRRQVAGALEALRQRGHELEAPPGGGVRLVRPVRLDAHLLERGFGARHVGHNVICFAEVDSTNDVAFDCARQGADGVVVTAEHQRSGRGRLGRKWLSPPGAGILASVLLPAEDELPHEALTIAAGLAVAEGVQQAAGVPTGIAWPNDVVVGGAKLAGVLVELRTVRRRRRSVIGFGVNVTAAPPAGQVARKTVHLADAAGSGRLERVEILRAVLASLEEWVCVLRSGRLERLHRSWCQRCGMVNNRIRVEARSGGAVRRLVGRVLDVNPLAGLVLLTDDGQTLHLAAATTSVLND